MYLSKTLCQFVKSNFILILLFIVFYSCTKQPAEGLRTINVLDAEQSSLKISEIADEITYVPLASDSILANIMNVTFCNDEYFVKDNKSKFLRFDKSGNLLNQIGRRGKGPGEYRYASNFVIHPKTGNIYISGGNPEQLMVFSREGQFLKTIELTKKGVLSLDINGENLFLFYLDGSEHNEENMELLDTDGNIILSYPNKFKYERGRGFVGFMGECITYLFNGKLHFKEIFSDTIFSIEGQNMIPQIILNSEDKRFTPEIRTKVIEEVSVDPRAPSVSMMNSVIQSNLFETSNFLFYNYGYNKKGRTLIFNKSTNKTIEIDVKEGIINDLDGGLNIHLKMKKDDNTVFSWINAYELKEYVTSEAFKNSTPLYPEKKKELEQLANRLTENDNPVLMLVKLKE